MEVLTRKATVAPTPLAALRPDVPRDLERAGDAHAGDLARSAAAVDGGDGAGAGQLIGRGAVARSSRCVLTDRVPRKKTPYVAAGLVAAAARGRA